MYYLCNHINHLSYTSKIGLLQLPPRSTSPQSPMYGHIYVRVFPTYRARGKRGHIGFGHSPQQTSSIVLWLQGSPRGACYLTKYLWDSLVFYPTSKQSLAVRMVVLCFHVCVCVSSSVHLRTAVPMTVLTLDRTPSCPISTLSNIKLLWSFPGAREQSKVFVGGSERIPYDPAAPRPHT